MSKWQEHKIENANNILTILTEFSKDYGMIYRGLANDWPLIPSIQRVLAPTIQKRIEIATWEAAAIQNFRRHAAPYLSPSQLKSLETMLGTLTLMQHYGAPTRLMDWTSSPWIAAYFAANSHPDEDGIVWAFDRDYLSRNTNFGIIATPDHTPGFIEDLNDLTGSKTITDWMNKSACAIPALTSYIYEFSDPRISAQQSLFTFSGTLGSNHADEIARRLPDDRRYRIVIPSHIKPDLVHLLWRMNIGPLSLFPGIDGVGRNVTDAIRAQLPIDHAGVAWVLRETNDGKDFGLP